VDEWAWRFYARETVTIALGYGVLMWSADAATSAGAAVVRAVVYAPLLAALAVCRINAIRRTDAEVIGTDPDIWREVHDALNTGDVPSDQAHDTALAGLIAARRSDWTGPSVVGSGWLLVFAAPCLLARLFGAPSWTFFALSGTAVIALVWHWRQDRRRLARLEAGLAARRRAVAGG
jgi:hypothetical protein